MKYAAGTLQSPDRIYFDLEATQLAAMLRHNGDRTTIGVNDQLVRRIRAVQRQDGLTRIVFDLRSPADYEVQTSPAPFQLTIAMHARDTTAKPPDDSLRSTRQDSTQGPTGSF